MRAARHLARNWLRFRRKNMSLIGDGLELLALLDKARNAELYKQLGDWIEKVRILQLENDRLHTEQRELKEQLRFKGVLERIQGHTFVQGDDEEICPRCAEVKSAPIHLIGHHSQRPPYQKAFCPECETEFQHNVPYTRQLLEKRSPT
jgi:hypothetical protein